MKSETFETLPEIASFLREQPGSKHSILLYAHNRTGKTRLSSEFKNLGTVEGERDTLLFPAAEAETK